MCGELGDDVKEDNGGGGMIRSAGFYECIDKWIGGMVLEVGGHALLSGWRGVGMCSGAGKGGGTGGRVMCGNVKEWWGKSRRRPGGEVEESVRWRE